MLLAVVIIINEILVNGQVFAGRHRLLLLLYLLLYLAAPIKQFCLATETVMGNKEAWLAPFMQRLLLLL